jgi:NAD(P)-dependent dehydrogenase (short-subunit alcohol dehydrogenase family)
MAGALGSKVIMAVGSGSPDHRALVVALAEAGADVVVAGPRGMPAEVQLNSISNEVWAIGRRSAVVMFDAADPSAYAAAVNSAREQMGRLDFVVRLDAVMDA